MRTGSRCISGDGYARSGSLVLRRGKAGAAPAAFACLAGTMRAGNRELRVSIKSDKWIRRMAVEGMIEPFEAGQVRHVNGEKIVSRSEEHTSELQSLMRISYAVFCLKKKKTKNTKRTQKAPYTTSTRL